LIIPLFGWTLFAASGMPLTRTRTCARAHTHTHVHGGVFGAHSTLIFRFCVALLTQWLINLCDVHICAHFLADKEYMNVCKMCRNINSS
jgi:hypothetical protein